MHLHPCTSSATSHWVHGSSPMSSPPHTQPSVGLQVAEAQEQLLYFFYTKKDARLV